MRRIIYLVSFIVSMLLALSFTAFAEKSSIDTEEQDRIAEAIDSASSGDSITINLINDIELTRNIIITKKITLTINFNGYQINYTGSTADTAETAGFYVFNSDAELILNGSNKLKSYALYEHYDDSVKPDMTGTGNLISVSHGTVIINDAYLYTSSNAWAINCVFAENNNSYVKIANSVIRAPKDSSRSAITSRGGNSHTSSIVKRKLTANNSVIYGGFKGYDYNFNFTTGTAFTNVKFYDFIIVNDCWYDVGNSTIKELMMITYESSAAMRECLFKSYSEENSDISVTTYTGKQNIKLINCTFNDIVGHLGSDRAGNAKIFVVIDEPNCQKEGRLLTYTGTTVSSKEESVGMVGHIFDSNLIPSYPNGYFKPGAYIVKCTLCDTEKVTDEEAKPLFTNLGYSINENGTSVSMGIELNQEAIDEYISLSKATLEYGFIAGNEKITVSVENGIAVTNGYHTVLSDKKLDIADLIINGISESTRDKKLVMEFYCYDKETLEYADGSLDKRSFNEIKEGNDKLSNYVKELLQSKHRLCYNEDGSFKVLILADLHMNVSGNSTDVSEVKERVKSLVDREKPDLVIFTGDNTIGSSNEQILRDNITAMVSYIEEKQIPWCHVYGNHDHEGALSKEEQQKIYESFEYCISKDVSDLSGVGNYVHAVYNQDGTIGSVIYLVDSGTYASDGGYDYIKNDQIAWYKQTSELLEEYNNGKPINGIMAFHIPLTENNDAYDNRHNKELVYETAGNKNENICCSKTDTNLFETVLSRGDIKAIVTGHDHINDYMYNYLGVKLCSSPNISDLTYYNADVQGARVFDLNASTIDNIPTYVSYLIERINPDNYNTYFKADSILEDFSDDKTTVNVTGYDASSLAGHVNFELIAGDLGEGKLLKVERSQTGNFELDILFDSEKYAKLGDNKYLLVYVDFTNVDFRKACFGLISTDGTKPYRTDDKDTTSPFYYLGDGESQWVQMSHGWDGCFGTAQNSSVNGLKGYLALPIENFSKSGAYMNTETLVTGIYIYADISSESYANVPFYYGSFILTDDYLTCFN